MGAASLLAAHRGERPVPLSRPLAEFPLSIGAWEGLPLTMSRKEAGILNADGVALVAYSRSGGRKPILFYAAYYAEQTAEKNIHSPKNCLPGSGWEILRSSVIRVRMGGPSSPPARVNLAVIQKGLRKQAVLYWYQERGRTFDSEYWGRFYLVKDALLLHRTDGALVRVSMPFSGSPARAVEAEVRFISRLTPILARYIPGRSRETGLPAPTLLPGGRHGPA